MIPKLYKVNHRTAGFLGVRQFFNTVAEKKHPLSYFKIASDGLQTLSEDNATPVSLLQVSTLHTVHSVGQDLNILQYPEHSHTHIPKSAAIL